VGARGGNRKVRGVIRKLGIEGGLWALISDAGETIELLDPPAKLRVDGARAEIEIDRDAADVTIGMTGASGRVKSFEIL
jgi:hypothetical protein